MDINVHVAFDKSQDTWVISRVWNICQFYEKDHALFSMPSHEKHIAYMNFAREIAETVGMRSAGGEDE